MNREDFCEQLLQDEDFFEQIPLLQQYLRDETILDKFYSLCRQTYLTQYSAKPVPLDNGGFGYYILEEAFTKLRNHIDDFIKGLSNENTTKLYQELLLALDKYYAETATHEETSSRSYIDYNQSNERFGHIGTYYNFDQIDWNYFKKGLGLETSKHS